MTEETPGRPPEADGNDDDRGTEPPPRLLLAVLTGFLGSGKTSLLKAWLDDPDMVPTAIVMNEFGAVGIDDRLVVGSTETVSLLGDGCLCCTVRSDLVVTIADLVERRDRGELPPFERIVVETTGLADPAPILQTLMTDPLILTRFRFDAVVATVDATQTPGQIARHREARRQIALADRLILTKTDLIAPETAAAATEAIRAHNPAAPILRAAEGEATPTAVFGAGLYDPTRRGPNAPRWLATDAYTPPAPEPSGSVADDGHTHDAHDGHRHSGSAGHAHGDIAALAVERDGPWRWADLADAMDDAIGRYGDRLLRLKGIVHLSDTDLPVVIHAVGHVFHPPLTLPEWPAEWRAGTPHTRLVAITQDLDPAEFFAAIDAAVAAARGEAVPAPAAE